MQGDSIQIRVSDMIFVLKKRWKMVLSLTMIGFIFGMLLLTVAYIRNSRQSYAANGSFAISTKNGEGIYTNGAQIANNSDFHLAEDMADAVSYVVLSDHVLREVISERGLLGVTPEELRSKLTIQQYQETQIMEMRFTWNSEAEAVNIWQSIIDVANTSLPNTLQVGQLAIINEPQVEQAGTSAASLLMPVILTMIGFFCGVGFAIIELLIRPTLNNAKDAETMFGLETIGIIPRDDGYFKRHRRSMLMSNDNERSSVVQNYSAAAYILRNRLGEKERSHCFYVTSSVAGEGKSTVAANLAIQLSDMEHKTLLIDFDMRNPSLGTFFMDKVDYAHSLNALYRNEATEEDAITSLTGYLDLLPAILEHNALSMDTTITELIQRLSDTYEYIILDSAPVGEASETLSLNRVANTVLFVVGYDSTPLPVIQNSLEKLDKSGIRVLGCVVNAVGERGRKSERRDVGRRETYEDVSDVRKTPGVKKESAPQMPESEVYTQDVSLAGGAIKRRNVLLELMPEEMSVQMEETETEQLQESETDSADRAEETPEKSQEKDVVPEQKEDALEEIIRLLDEEEKKK